MRRERRVHEGDEVQMEVVDDLVGLIIEEKGGPIFLEREISYGRWFPGGGGESRWLVCFRVMIINREQ